jgi:hypothetical protein
MRAIIITAAAFALLATGANAQSSAPPAKKPGMFSSMTAKPKPAPAMTSSMTTTKTSTVAMTHNGKPRTAESIACSNEANSKNIHGKDRKKFMSSCKAAAKH